MLECLGNLRGKMQRLAPVESALLLQILLERDALDQLHDDVIDVSGSGDIVDADDIRMRQHRDRLRLGMEATAELLIPRKIVLQNFHRHQSVQPMVQRLIHHCHASGTDRLENFIAVVQQSADIIFHSNSYPLLRTVLKRRTAAEIILSVSVGHSAISTEVTLSGAPRSLAISSRRWQQSALFAPCATSNRIS